MKIALTGGAGFLGRFVHSELISRGICSKDIVIVRKQNYDLTKQQDVTKLYDDIKPSVVVHLAAEVGGIGANMANPGRYFYSNLSMGLNLIEGARLFGVKKFIQVGTVCAYPKICPIPFVEEDLWNGYPEETNAPYGVAKKALFVMLDSYKKQYDLNSVILVPCNLYGPYDNFDPSSSHVIPALIKRFVEAKNSKQDSVVCWGDGNATREFLFVRDAAVAIADCLNMVDDASTINLGGGLEISIKNLAEKIARLVGYDGNIVWDESKPNGQPRRFLNISRAEKLLGWKPIKTLDDGLKETIDWYVESNQ